MARGGLAAPRDALVEIQPLHALRYAPGEDLDAVTAPPYDVIPPALLERLRREPHGFVHVTLPAGEGDARYRRAAEALRAFQRDGVLVREPPGYYACTITYRGPEGTHTATGLFARLRLDAEYRDVKPHERTHRGPKEDRLALTRTTATDTEPIQLLVQDSAGEVKRLLARAAQGPALMHVTDHEGSLHQAWRVPEDLAPELTRLLAPRPLYIADGHHRYETACAYAKELGGAGPWWYKFVAIFALEDPGLTIFPTHRLLRGLDDADAALRSFESKFLPERHPLPSGTPAEVARRLLGWVREGARKGHCFGLLTPQAFRRIVIPAGRVPRGLPKSGAAWARLDVAVLHHVVLPAAFRVTEENAERLLAYTRSASEAVEAVQRGEAQVAVFMNPPRLSDVVAVADAGETMPQKSTYFMPKLRSGLLVQPFEEAAGLPSSGPQRGPGPEA